MSCHGPQHRLLETFLALVEKPSRYIGGEANAADKDRAACVAGSGAKPVTTAKTG